MKRLLVLLVASALGALGLVPSAEALGTELTPTSGHLVNRWSALNQVKTRKLSLADVGRLAVNSDLVVVKSGDGYFVPTIRKANPNATVLVYTNGAFAQKNEGTAYPESWYARDALGNKITQPNFGNYLMDISNAGWIQSRVDECRSYLAATGADGCYNDMLMTAPLFKNYVTAKPINPATNRPWTFPAYQAQVERIADAVRLGTGRVHAANGVGNGKRWFTGNGGSSKTITDHTDAAHSEIWIRDRNLAPDQWPTVAKWQQDIDMVVEAEAEGRTVMVETKLWATAKYPTIAPALAARWHTYALASFLLGTEGHFTWFCFDSGRTFESMMSEETGENLRLGGPTSSYAVQASGVYSRRFDTGFVAVNPQDTARTVTLPSGDWTDVDGGTVLSGAVTLQPHTALVTESGT